MLQINFSNLYSNEVCNTIAMAIMMRILILLFLLVGMPHQMLVASTQQQHTFQETSIASTPGKTREQRAEKCKCGKRQPKIKNTTFALGIFLFLMGLTGIIALIWASANAPLLMVISSIILIAGDIMMCVSERVCILKTLFEFWYLLSWF